MKYSALLFLSFFTTSLFAQNINEFAFDCYKNLDPNEDNNLLFSPTGIASAMSLTYLGAVGETKDEMQEVLFFDENPSKTYLNTSLLATQLKGYNSNVTKMKVVNSIWLQQGLKLNEEYVNKVVSDFPEGIKYIDFRRNPARNVQTINGWVSNQTNNQIGNLLENGTLDAQTKMVLTNAIYFKGEWDTKFDDRLTMSDDFVTADGSKVTAQFMSTAKNNRVSYYQNNLLEVIELPYKGKDLSMVIVLPRADQGLDNLEKTMVHEDFEFWTTHMTKRNVKVMIPRFKLNVSVNASDKLAAMGMETAFTNRANFSKMMGDAGRGDLKLKSVIHQTNIEMTENGTEASAATAVIGTSKGLSPINTLQFKADHPFLFFIKENKTNKILFMGRMNNPSSTKVNLSKNNLAASSRYPSRSLRTNAGMQGTTTKGVNNSSTSSRPTTGASYYQPKNIIIPISSNAVVETEKTNIGQTLETSATKSLNVHTVKKGETLYQIARRYNIPIHVLKSSNSLTSNTLKEGQELVLSGTSTSAAFKTKGSTQVLHKVEAGHTLYGISKKYGVSVDEIKQLNNLSSNNLNIGQELTIKKAAATFPEEFKKKGLSAQEIEKMSLENCNCEKYAVKKGDTLYSIARQYEVEVSKIMFVNKLEKHDLSVGQELIIELKR